ncbi:MAG: DNA polymerase III subunit delta [Lachnospiraceae bacterium]|nr:DNA polymerase III subunit delta [Lachnospiraceae bacterium]
MKSLIADLKSGNFRHVYLLTGEEVYLRDFYRKKLLDALLPDINSMNRNHYEGKGLNEGAIIDQAETMPFFSARRVIDICDSGLFKGSADQLPEYVKKLPDYLYMVFTESEVDKRSRMYKAVKSVGSIVEFQEQTEATLTRWVLKMLGDAGLRIRQNDMSYLLSRTGTDMAHIQMEVNKVICYCHEKGQNVVDVGVLNEVTTERVENRIFDMVAAVTSHNKQLALDLYADLLTLKEPPMRILFLIGRQFQQLLVINEMSAAGHSPSEVASAAGMPPFAVRKNLPVARKYTPEGLRQRIAYCVSQEEAVKTGAMNDQLAVELVLVRLSTT